MGEPKPSEYDDPQEFEAAWKEYNEGGRVIEVDADKQGNINPDSLIGPLPDMDE